MVKFQIKVDQPTKYSTNEGQWD